MWSEVLCHHIVCTRNRKSHVIPYRVAEKLTHIKESKVPVGMIRTNSVEVQKSILQI
jgi:hypothetical protein